MTVLMIVTIVFMPIISLGNFVAPTKMKNSRIEEKTPKQRKKAIATHT